MKKYKTIVVDPPWKYGTWGKSSVPRNKGHIPKDEPMPYETMTVEEIKALKVGDLADENCELYLWTTQKYLRDAFDILDAWGFKYCQTLIWCKTPMGTGQGGVYCPTTEFLLLGRIGKMPNVKRIDTTWWNVKRTNKHSKKPEFFQDLIETVSDAPRLELFARRERENWDVWGNEVNVSMNVINFNKINENMNLENKWMQSSFYDQLPAYNKGIDLTNYRQFYSTFYERQQIFVNRYVHKIPRPQWSNDAILRDRKFTNAYRELDRSSQFCIQNILSDENQSFENLVFRMLIFRIFNVPKVFEYVGLPTYENFKINDFKELIADYYNKFGNCFTTAYMMTASNGKDLKKYELYFLNTIPQIYKSVSLICGAIKNKESIETILNIFLDIQNVANFLSYEFYLDLCYIAKYNLLYDKLIYFTENDFVNVGPGCSTGLRIIFPNKNTYKKQLKGLELLYDNAEKQLKQYTQLNNLPEFQYLHWDKAKKRYYFDSKFNLTKHNIEFWLCEYQKYWKVQNGVGKQRQSHIANENKPEIIYPGIND